MRNVFLSAISVLFFIIPSVTLAKGKKCKTPEDLGKAVFNAFKKKDATAFQSLYINEKEFEALLKSASMDAEQKNYTREKFQRESPVLKSLVNFQEVSEELAGSGINISNAKLDHVEFGTNNEKGVSVSKVKVFFTDAVSGKKGTFRMRDCLKSIHGWKLIEEVHLDIDYSNDYNKQLTDSLAMDSMMKVLAQQLQNSVDTTYSEPQYEDMGYYSCDKKIDSVSHLLKGMLGKWIMSEGDSTNGFFLISRKPVMVTADNKSGWNVSVVYSSDCKLEVSLHGFGLWPVCVEPGSKILITFADGTWLEKENNGEKNCYGDAKFGFDSGSDNLEQLRTKKIHSIKIEMPEGVFEKIFTVANGNDLYDTVNCMPK
ncbi:MAG TPA: hypothetical protein VI112_03845 [Bacteroidia bacterium]|jgi:hypothetical protein